MSPSSYQTAPPRNNKGAHYRGANMDGQPLLSSNSNDWYSFDTGNTKEERQERMEEKQAKKSLRRAKAFIWCRREDLNLHGVSPTTPSR